MSADEGGAKRAQISEELQRREERLRLLRDEEQKLFMQREEHHPFAKLRMGDVAEAQRSLEALKGIDRKIKGLARKIEEAQKLVQMAEERMNLWSGSGGEE